jgi:MmyB-like transcription regulator ligand binding domain
VSESEAEVRLAAELRSALGRYPADEYLGALIEDLRLRSPRFAELWEQRPVAHAPSRRKTFLHPEIGTIALDCDALAVHGSDLNVIVYTAPSGSSDAASLALLATVGLQAFSS